VTRRTGRYRRPARASSWQVALLPHRLCRRRHRFSHQVASTRVGGSAATVLLHGLGLNSDSTAPHRGRDRRRPPPCAVSFRLAPVQCSSRLGALLGAQPGSRAFTRAVADFYRCSVAIPDDGEGAPCASARAARSHSRCDRQRREPPGTAAKIAARPGGGVEPVGVSDLAYNPPAGGLVYCEPRSERRGTSLANGCRPLG
jgi:hypothetical protein